MTEIDAPCDRGRVLHEHPPEEKAERIRAWFERAKAEGRLDSKPVRPSDDEGKRDYLEIYGPLRPSDREAF